MKIQLSFLLVLLILLVTSVQMSSCRNIVDDSAREERIRASFVSTFKRHFHIDTGFINEPFTLLLDTNKEYQENNAVGVLGIVLGIGDVVAVSSAG
nr:hypothetical protein [Tanacetum cinerariifolium]